LINLVIFLASIIVFTYGCETAGCGILRLLKCTPVPKAIAVSWGTGIAFLILLLTVFGMLGLYLNPVLWSIWTALLVLGTGRIIHHCKSFRSQRFKPERETEWISLICQISAFVLLAICFLTVMTPETRHDPYDYHLMVPTVYLAEGAITEIPWHVFSYMPKNTEMLYLLALGIGNDSVAKLIHFIFGCFCLLILASWVQSSFKKEGLWLAVFLTATMPLFGFIATSAYVDLALGFWQLLSLYCLSRTKITENPEISPFKWFLLSAFFAGMALGTKYVAFAVFLPAYVICAGMCLWQSSNNRTKTVFSMSVVGMIPVIAWLALNMSWTKNPLYPLFPTVFGFHIPPAEEAYTFFRNHAPPLEVFKPANVIPFIWMRFSRLMLDGNALFVVGIIAALAYPVLKKAQNSSMRDVPFQSGIFLFVSLSTLAFLAGTDNHDGRFFFATLVLLSIPSAQALMALHQAAVEQRTVGRVILPLILLFFFFNGVSYRFAQMNDQRETFIPIVTTEQRDEWLVHRFPDYDITDWSNHHLPQDSVVMGMGYPLQRRFISKSKFGYLPGVEPFTEDSPALENISKLRQLGVTHFLNPNPFFTLPDDADGTDYLGIHPLYQHRGKTVYQIN